MAIVNTLKIYEILKPKLHEEPAKAIADVIERALEEYQAQQQEDQKKLLATEQDMAEVKKEIAETKAEIIKWMFIFWAGQIFALVGILLTFFKR